MSSGVQRRVQGAFIGTGSEIEIRTVGFRPTRVELYNADDPGFLVWFAGMPDASGFKHVDDASTFLSSNGITPLSNGFKIGADSDMNANTEKVFYEAFE